MATTPKAIICDLDGTLTLSRQSIPQEMSALITDLLAHIPFAIMSGASRELFEHQVLEGLSIPRASQFYIFPSNAAVCYRINKSAHELMYLNALSTQERATIAQTLNKVVAESSVLRNIRVHGNQIDDREFSITFSALGKDAPLKEKLAWDPDHAKRNLIAVRLRKLLPNFEVSIGGTTSIDITKKGVDKAYGVRWLSDELKIETSEMLYLGDAIFEGGNDQVVVPTGVQTKLVSGPEQTQEILSLIRDALDLRQA